MRILLLKYNKVANETLEILSKSLGNHELRWGNLVELGRNNVDLLSYTQISRYLEAFEPVDMVVVSDVFWPTGQHICRWCTRNLRDVKCLFIQHGQWIYVTNKKKLREYPTHAVLFGDNVTNECKSWSFGKSVSVVSTGSPRYDSYAPSPAGEYVFFSPPVIQELVHGRPKHVREPYLRALQYIVGFDKEIRVILQPHYREARLELLMTMFPDAEFVDPDDRTINLVAGAKTVVASRNSTVVLDAIVCGKPTVFTEFPNCDAAYFRRGYFGKFGLENDGSQHFLKNVLSTNNIVGQDYELQARPYICLGDASERIVEIIEGR